MSYASQVIADGAVNYWRLAETTGPVVDSIGGASGTVTGTLLRGVPGALADGNPALNCTDTGGVLLPSIALPLTFSVEGWIKQSTAPTQNMLWTNRGDVSLLTPFLAVNVGLPTFGTAIPGEACQSPVSIADGLWHHLVGTSSGTVIQIFVDAVLKQTVPAVIPASSGIAKIGDDAVSGFADASLDEVAVYPLVLSPAQVTNHYALRLFTGASRRAPFPAGVLSHRRFPS